MREVEGYVFVASFGYYEQIFGRRVDPKIAGDYENLASNRIQPYKTIKEAKTGSEKFERHMHDVKRTRLGALEMQIAESVEELEHFRNKSSLIVIASFDLGQEFFGKIVEGKEHRSSLPGMPLTKNGFKPFDSVGLSAYEKAVHMVSEINRQAQSPAIIATFNLKFIQ